MNNSFPPSSYRRRFYLQICLILSAFLTISIGAHAQYTTASMNGTVTDRSGSAVQGAHVAVRNVNTGSQTATTTNNAGAFTVPALGVGTYQVTIEKSGFNKSVQTGINLAVGQVANVPVTLTVGDVSQSVTVSANAQVIETQTGTVSQVIDRRKIVDLPLNGRQPQALLFLAAGTVNETGNYCLTACQGGVYPGEQDQNVGGAGPRAVNFQMDGNNHNDVYLNTNLPFPNPDAIQEFSVQSDNLSAQYGVGAGAVVNIITKSGTNEIHGDAFEFIRNGAVNARNFFAPTPDTLKRNQYGGDIGFPILKNKLFLFGTYQGTPIRSAAQGMVSFVPTAQERTGNFSDISTPIVDPNTGAQFAGNMIPASRLSPAAQKLLQTIPLPNGPNGEVTYAGPSLIQNDNQWMVKPTWISGKNTLNGSFFWTQFDEPPDIAAARRNLLAADNQGNHIKVQNLALNDTYTASANLLFNSWFGWTSQTGGFRSGAPYSLSSQGVQVASPPIPQIYIYVPGYFTIDTTDFGNFDRGSYTGREDVTLEKGSHELHLGGEFIRVTNNIQNGYTQSGEFNFAGALSGTNISDFLLGNQSEFLQGGGEYKNLEGVLWSLYAQDNIRVTPKLHVELGIRWDPYFPYTETHGRVVCYQPGVQSQKFPNAPTGLIFGGPHHDATCPANSGSDTNAMNFAPRAGFAYQLGSDGKTVIRGGAGIFYSPIALNLTNGQVDTAPFSPRFDLIGNVSFDNPFGSQGLANPFPAQFASSAPAKNVQFSLPVSVYTFMQPHWQEPRLATWNLNVERQFGKSWGLRLAYAGNKGTHLYNGTLNFPEVNPALYIPGASTEDNLQSRRINPAFGSVGTLYSDNNSHYESFRVNVQNRISNGLSVLANYTWSKMIDDFGNTTRTDPFNRRFDYGVSNDDVPQVFNLSVDWSLPKVPLHGIASAILNGWELNGLTNWRAGFAYSIFSGVDNSLSGVYADRADTTGISPILSSGRPHGQLIQQYFNVSAFTPNAIGTFGNSGKNILRGPRSFNTDMSLVRNVKLHERFDIELRAEFFNVFNNVNFFQPNNFLSSGASFGTITGASDPRILQGGVKLSF